MSVSSSLLWMGTAQCFGLGLQFATQIVLARILSLHDAGIYAVALAMMGALSLIQNLGLQALIVREARLTPEVAATTFTVQLLISFAVAAIIYALSFVGAAALGDAGVGRALAALALLPLLSAISFLPLAMLEREGRFKHIAFVTSLGSIAGAIATTVAVLSGARFMGAVYGQWATAGMTSLLMILTARRHFTMMLSFKGWRRVADFGIQLLAINGVNALGLRLSDLILPHFLGLGALGLYSRASGLNGLLWANIHVLISRVLLVDFARLVRNEGSLRVRYLETVDLTTALLWPVFAGFAVVAGPFILIVFGARWLPAAVPLMLLAGSSIVLVGITMTWEIFTATNNLHVQARIEFIRAFVALTLFVGGCMFGLEAVAASRMLEALFAVALYRPHINSMTDTRTSDYWPIYGRNVLFTLLATGPAMVAMTLNGWRPEIPLASLAVSVAVGAILWISAIIRFQHPLWRALRATRVGGRLVLGKASS